MDNKTILKIAAIRALRVGGASFLGVLIPVVVTLLGNLQTSLPEYATAIIVLTALLASADKAIRAYRENINSTEPLA